MSSSQPQASSNAGGARNKTGLAALELDLELAPKPTKSRQRAATTRHLAPSPARSSWRIWIFGLLAISSCGATAWFVVMATLADRGHAHWKYVAQAKAQSLVEQENVLILVDNGQLKTAKGEFLLTPDDVNIEASTNLAAACEVNDGPSRAETSILQQAQIIPVVRNTRDNELLEREEPTLSEVARGRFKNGTMRLFNLQLIDCCDEDGDVVEVLLNNESFAVTPLTHDGATLCLPLDPGKSANLTLRGIRDGDGGGITVLLRTSSGDFYAAPIEKGESLMVKLKVNAE